MTMISNIKIECGVCGKESMQRALLSTNSFGTPDLDFRPPGMSRNTMNTWIFECPHCGYVASRLDEKPEIDSDFIKTDKYINCDGFEFEKDLAERFFKGYLIANEKDNTRESFFNLLHCAWACDDGEDIENARKIRKLSLVYLDEMIQMGGEEKDNFVLMKADLLRRSGEFDRVVEEYTDIILGDELLDKIITFQIIKARQKDDACYTVEDVNNDMHLSRN